MMEHGGIIGKTMTYLDIVWHILIDLIRYPDLTSRRYWNDGEWGIPKWLDISG